MINVAVNATEPPAAPGDTALDRVTLSGGDAAFEAAYAQAWPSVLRFALAWTNDWAAAEDLAQDAFMRLWRSRDRVDWCEPVLPWLLVATRHLATDRFRHLRLALVPRVRTLPDVDDDARLEWLDVQAGLAGLTPLERAALSLTILDGLETTETASILGIAPNAVRSAISRARHKLEVER